MRIRPPARPNTWSSRTGLPGRFPTTRVATTSRSPSAVASRGSTRLAGRWKLILLFHLFDGKVQRYSDFERLVPGISQKMLAQQLRQLEADGLMSRTVYPEVLPKVEYRLTDAARRCARRWMRCCDQRER